MRTQYDYNQLAIRIAEELNRNSKQTPEAVKSKVQELIPQAKITIIDGNKKARVEVNIINQYFLKFIVFKNTLVAVEVVE